MRWVLAYFLFHLSVVSKPESFLQKSSPEVQSCKVVLILAGTELTFLLVAAVFWI